MAGGAARCRAVQVSEPNLAKMEKERAGPMPMFVRELREAIRAGRKTQTRRVIKFPVIDRNGTGCDIAGCEINSCLEQGLELALYGPVGCIRYLREPLICGVCPIAHYRDDDRPVMVKRRTVDWGWQGSSLSQMMMPRLAARTYLRITNIRVERVQEISEGDAYAEGITDKWPCDKMPYLSGYGGRAVINNFAKLWDSINGKTHPWAKNEWVFAYTFELVK